MNAREMQSPLRNALASVLVSTCNRKDTVVPTIRSVQACGYPEFELFILDQSSDDKTEQAVRELCRGDRRVTYVRLDQPSKPRALNHGRQLARGRYVLLTDDDCTVVPGWISAAVQTLEAAPCIGCVFGDVDAGPHDSSKGYVPICRIVQAHAIFTLSAFLTMPGRGNFGIGANMALRADTLSRIGGWDPRIGPGATFGSGDDNDVAVRILVAGWGIAFCPSARVIHHGFRLWESMSRDNARYGFGMGAIFAKHMRCGTYYPGALRLLNDGLLISVRRLWLGERPLALAYPRNWLRGFSKALGQPLDRRTHCFISDEGESGADGKREFVLRDQQDHKQVRVGGAKHRSQSTDA